MTDSNSDQDRDEVQQPEEMGLEELREEYQELAGLGPSEPWEQDRKMDIWYELCDRVDVEQPECPECCERNWGQSPGEPVRCNACDHMLGRDPDLRQEIQNAWNEIMYGDDSGKELATDGGVALDDVEDPVMRELLEDDGTRKFTTTDTLAGTKLRISADGPEDRAKALSDAFSAPARRMYSAIQEDAEFECPECDAEFFEIEEWQEHHLEEHYGEDNE